LLLIFSIVSVSIFPLLFHGFGVEQRQRPMPRPHESKKATVFFLFQLQPQSAPAADLQFLNNAPNSNAGPAPAGPSLRTNACVEKSPCKKYHDHDDAAHVQLAAFESPYPPSATIS
jgi:hypothetical protein